MRVNVNIIENIKIPIWFNQIEKFVKQVLKKLKKYRGEISVVFCDDEYMKTVNKQYRNIDESTDILSFESQMEAKFFLQKIYEAIYGKYLGDIFISLNMLKINAKYFEVSEIEELQRLLIHGILHLCGYDHEDEHLVNGVEPNCEMLKLQEKLLKEFLPKKIIKEK
ncbi:MAG: rRNA maturation RNase YbeY [Treponema sp.]|nr:rRNA maturation RNase YbeY [Treponema sp.]